MQCKFPLNIIFLGRFNKGEILEVFPLFEWTLRYLKISRNKGNCKSKVSWDRVPYGNFFFKLHNVHLISGLLFTINILFTRFAIIFIRCRTLIKERGSGEESNRRTQLKDTWPGHMFTFSWDKELCGLHHICIYAYICNESSCVNW